MNDKVMHLIAGAVIGVIALALFGGGAAVAAAVLVGAAKEVYDRVADGVPDFGDFVATGLGGMLVEAAALIGVTL